MNSGRNEREIQELAYTIWEAEGRPVGQAERHWNMALGLTGTVNDQSMLGENLSGDNFLGDSVNSSGLADIIPDSQQYSKSQIESPQQVVQGSASRSSSTAESKNKKRPGKKKSSDSILV
jgi:hypothetical protein